MLISLLLVQYCINTYMDINTKHLSSCAHVCKYVVCVRARWLAYACTRVDACACDVVCACVLACMNGCMSSLTDTNDTK